MWCFGIIEDFTSFYSGTRSIWRGLRYIDKRVSKCDFLEVSFSHNFFLLWDFLGFLVYFQPNHIYEGLNNPYLFCNFPF